YQGRHFADRVDREIRRLLMLDRWQVEPGRFPLEPFFQKGYARFARIGSRLIVEHLQHRSILLPVPFQLFGASTRYMPIVISARGFAVTSWNRTSRNLVAHAPDRQAARL